MKKLNICITSKGTILADISYSDEYNYDPMNPKSGIVVLVHGFMGSKTA